MLMCQKAGEIGTRREGNLYMIQDEFIISFKGLSVIVGYILTYINDILH